MNDVTPLSPKAQGYLDLWVERISSGISQLRSQPVTAEPLAEDSSASASSGPADGGLWIRSFGGKAGEHAFFLANPDALRFAQLLAGKTSGEEELNAAMREVAVQFFEQIATMISVADWLGFEGELEVSEMDHPAWQSAGRIAFRFSAPEGPLFDLQASLSADFLAALQSAKTPASAPPPEATAAPARPVAAGPARGVDLDLLLDVELDVTLRFGQREMLLGDILKLAPGGVLELDQEIHDPVELLVGAKVVAWGELVNVDGNYGLRITGLASREERLQSLRA